MNVKVIAWKVFLAHGTLQCRLAGRLAGLLLSSRLLGLRNGRLLYWRLLGLSGRRLVLGRTCSELLCGSLRGLLTGLGLLILDLFR